MEISGVVSYGPAARQKKTSAAAIWAVSTGQGGRKLDRGSSAFTHAAEVFIKLLVDIAGVNFRHTVRS